MTRSNRAASPGTVQAEERTDIVEHVDVERLVRRFYQRAIPDPLLGPVFQAFGVDWAAHVPLLVAFWSRELLGEPGWTGNVAAAHRRVLDLAPFGAAELDRWVELFDEVVDELFVGPTAERASARAHQVADALRILVRRRAEVARGAACA